MEQSASHISQEQFFDAIYRLYHEKGLTTTAVKLIDEFGWYEQWKEYLTVQKVEQENADYLAGREAIFKKITLL